MIDKEAFLCLCVYVLMYICIYKHPHTHRESKCGKTVKTGKG